MSDLVYDFLPCSSLPPEFLANTHHHNQAKKYAELLHKWQAAQASDGRMRAPRGIAAHIIGDRGNGKTTFLRSLQAELAGSGWRTVWLDLETLRSTATVRPVPYLLSQIASLVGPESRDNGRGAAEEPWCHVKDVKNLQECAWSSIDEETAAQVALAFATDIDRFKQEYGRLRDGAHSLSDFVQKLNPILGQGKSVLIVLDDIDLLDHHQAIDLLTTSAYLTEHSRIVRFASLSEDGLKRLHGALYRQWTSIDWSAVNLGKAWAAVAGAQAAARFADDATDSARYARDALVDDRQRSEARAHMRRLLGIQRSTARMNAVRKLMFLRWPDDMASPQVLPASWVCSEVLDPAEFATDEQIMDVELRKKRHLAMIARLAQFLLARKDSKDDAGTEVVGHEMLVQLLFENSKRKEDVPSTVVDQRINELLADYPVMASLTEQNAGVFLDNFPSNWREAALFTNFVIQQRSQIIGEHQPFDRLTPWRFPASRQFRSFGSLLYWVAPECKLAEAFWLRMNKVLREAAAQSPALPGYESDIMSKFPSDAERLKRLARAVLEVGARSQERMRGEGQAPNGHA